MNWLMDNVFALGQLPHSDGGEIQAAVSSVRSWSFSYLHQPLAGGRDANGESLSFVSKITVNVSG